VEDPAVAPVWGQLPRAVQSHPEVREVEGIAPVAAQNHPEVREVEGIAPVAAPDGPSGHGAANKDREEGRCMVVR